MRESRQYGRESKVEALRLLETSGKSAAQLERELGFGKGNLSHWKRQSTKEGEDAFPGHDHQTPEKEELRKLERENEILRQECDIPKEGYRIFSEREL